MTDANETFASRLKSIRESKGLSQRALARLCGISGAAISLLESGQTIPTWPTVQLLARALEVGCDDLQDEALELPAPSPPPRPRGRPRKAESEPEAPAEKPAGRKGTRKKKEG